MAIFSGLSAMGADMKRCGLANLGSWEGEPLLGVCKVYLRSLALMYGVYMLELFL
jgi:hypothetical protein